MHRLVLLLFTTLTWTGTTAADPQANFSSVTPENFDSGGPVSRQFHLNPESYLTMATIARTRPARELQVRLRDDVAAFDVRYRGGRTDFVAYASRDELLDSVIVLHDGDIVFEAYRGMHPWQRHFSWSVSKIMAAAAIAALVHQDRVDPDQPVDAYIDALGDTAWAGTLVRDIANMASGIDCLDDDGYQVTTTCIYRMEETLGITAPAGYEENFLDHLRAMDRRGAPGDRYEYVSANTNVLMLIVEAVTEMPYASAVRELIWDRIGPEADALIAINDEGHAYASGGLAARLRDIARFGQLFTEPEAFGVFDEEIVEDMQNSGVRLGKELQIELIETFGGDLPARASWQWDRVWEDGAMFKSGYLGQGLYVDPDRELVIAWFGTGQDFDERNNDMLSVSRQLARSGLFDP